MFNIPRTWRPSLPGAALEPPQLLSIRFWAAKLQTTWATLLGKPKRSLQKEPPMKMRSEGLSASIQAFLKHLKDKYHRYLYIVNSYYI